ncbi:hypothetical protein SAMCCGM7_pB0231 (plasmid) [Sinorhizobium americanum CCGM7]|nr:hypothetical protein SAMCCGM7_pB0231 [Sinorhizobium americanum CCGM7]
MRMVWFNSLGRLFKAVRVKSLTLLMARALVAARAQLLKMAM